MADSLSLPNGEEAKTAVVSFSLAWYFSRIPTPYDHETSLNQHRNGRCLHILSLTSQSAHGHNAAFVIPPNMSFPTPCLPQNHDAIDCGGIGFSKSESPHTLPALQPFRAAPGRSQRTAQPRTTATESHLHIGRLLCRVFMQ